MPKAAKAQKRKAPSEDEDAAPAPGKGLDVNAITADVVAAAAEDKAVRPTKRENLIRPVALAVIRRPQDGAMLVFEGGQGASRFHRPLGGGIEFGETAEEAVRRELKEEIGAELRDVLFVGVLENLFELDGAPGHEIVFVFVADFEDTRLYDRERLAYVEGNEKSEAIWVMHERAPNPERPPLCPGGLLAFLEEGERNLY